jgi:hypothetical protein
MLLNLSSLMIEPDNVCEKKIATQVLSEAGKHRYGSREAVFCGKNRFSVQHSFRAVISSSTRLQKRLITRSSMPDSNAVDHFVTD